MKKSGNTETHNHNYSLFVVKSQKLIILITDTFNERILHRSLGTQISANNRGYHKIQSCAKHASP